MLLCRAQHTPALTQQHNTAHCTICVPICTPYAYHLSPLAHQHTTQQQGGTHPSTHCTCAPNPKHHDANNTANMKNTQRGPPTPNTRLLVAQGNLVSGSLQACNNQQCCFWPHAALALRRSVPTWHWLHGRCVNRSGTAGIACARKLDHVADTRQPDAGCTSAGSGIDPQCSKHTQPSPIYSTRRFNR